LVHLRASETFGILEIVVTANHELALVVVVFACAAIRCVGVVALFVAIVGILNGIELAGTMTVIAIVIIIIVIWYFDKSTGVLVNCKEDVL